MERFKYETFFQNSMADAPTTNKLTIDKIVEELGLEVHERVVNGNFATILSKNKQTDLTDLYNRVVDYFNKHHKNFTASFDNEKLPQAKFSYNTGRGVEELEIFSDRCGNVLFEQATPAFKQPIFP